MRDLTKSTLSAGLAMSLFGMQSMMSAFRRPSKDGPNQLVEALDTVTQAMVNQSGNTVRQTFHTVDKVQRELVDLTFGFLTLAPMRPGEGGLGTMSGATRQATEGIRRWMGDMTSRASCGSCGGMDAPGPGPSTAHPSQPGGPTPEGWGPMPGKS